MWCGVLSPAASSSGGADYSQLKDSMSKVTSRVCVCMCVCMRVCCACVRACVLCMCACVCLYIHACMGGCVHACVCWCARMYCAVALCVQHMYIRTYMCTVASSGPAGVVARCGVRLLWEGGSQLWHDMPFIPFLCHSLLCQQGLHFSHPKHSLLPLLLPHVFN